ncbi:MAG: 50S ribosomal protein L29 [Chloroflexota bacterium]|nr:MAG: 50S ribosomal protein L29 [Chloroflexota bacterium]
MKASEIRDLSTDAILARMSDAREELMKLRFQQSTGELSDFMRLRHIRRDIARYETVITERQQAAMMEGEK